MPEFQNYKKLYIMPEFQNYKKSYIMPEFQNYKKLYIMPEFQNYKVIKSYINHTCSDKAINDTVVNRALSSLHGGSL